MKKANIIVALLLVVTIVLAVFAVYTINSSTLRYYRTQYNTCLSGYNDCKREARLSQYAMIRNLYEDMADDYQDLMSTWQKRIDKEVSKHMVFGAFTIVSAVATVVAAIVINKKKKNASEGTLGEGETGEFSLGYSDQGVGFDPAAPQTPDHGEEAVSVSGTQPEAPYGTDNNSDTLL